MITLPPYLYDREIFPMISAEEAMWLNKLYLAQKLGHVCGPTGVAPPEGDLVVRPIMNMFGLGEGGFYKFNRQTPNDLAGMQNRPGYFWQEYYEGDRVFTEYINDVPMWSMTGVTDESGLSTFVETLDHNILPAILKGLSRYLLVETIGGNVIEISFRMLASNARPEVIADYQTIDPSYSPTDIEYGLVDSRKTVAKPYLQRGHYWKVLDDTRRPFPTN